jgi:hypothetical protein
VALLIDHQAISVPAGSRDFGPVAVPDGLARVTLRLARRTAGAPTLWAPGVTVKLDSWCSLDGGVTWVQWLGFGAPGGVYVGRGGVEQAESSVSAPLPPGAGRLMKLTAVVAGGTLVSQLTVEAV